MKSITHYVGLDVHKDSITIAVAHAKKGNAAFLSKIPNEYRYLLRQLRRLGRPENLRVCYEAGPLGFGLYRALKADGISCQVVAPSLIPVQAGERVKTDRRDAVKLARFLRTQDLMAVEVPDEEREAIRDLERARQDAKQAQTRARHQLSKFLLRQGRIYPGKTPWTKQHKRWLCQQKFAHEAQQLVLEDYLHTVEQADDRVARLDEDLAQAAQNWSLAPLVQQLMAMRGIKILTAVTLVAELGDITRFDDPRQLMSFVGLVPSEHSSGPRTRRGGITRTGNKQARRVLVEAAWSYRYRPRLSEPIKRRNQQATERVKAIAWEAQRRLHRRMCVLQGRGKNKQQTVTAIARELVGFIWAIAWEVKADQQKNSTGTIN